MKELMMEQRGSEEYHFECREDIKDQLFRPPKHLHITLNNENIQDKQIFIIGDVHGCLDVLKALLKKGGLLDQDDKLAPDVVLVFCGDLVNKGPQSLETLNFVRSLVGAYVVRGNHEDKMLKRLFQHKKNQSVPLDVKYLWLDSVSEECTEYLLDLPYSLSIPYYNTIVVHAGLVPGIPLDLQDPRVMTNLLNIDTKSDGCFQPIMKDGITVGVPWASLWQGPQFIYFGHDSRGLKTYSKAVCLDTGCVRGGSLTGIFISGQRKGEVCSVQSPRDFRYKKKSKLVPENNLKHE